MTPTQDPGCVTGAEHQKEVFGFEFSERRSACWGAHRYRRSIHRVTNNSNECKYQGQINLAKSQQGTPKAIAHKSGLGTCSAQGTGSDPGADSKLRRRAITESGVKSLAAPAFLGVLISRLSFWLERGRLLFLVPDHLRFRNMIHSTEKMYLQQANNVP